MRSPIVAFDDVVHGTSATYSSSHLNEVLANQESYAIQVVIDRIGACDNVTVQLETSADGRNWLEKNPGQPEVYGTTPAVTTYTFTGVDMGVRPALGLVRVRVQLGGAGSAHVRVYVREGPDSGFVPARLRGCRLWLRADLGVTLAAGGGISSWRDMSANGHDAAQATSTRQPTMAPAASRINAQQTVYFDASTAGSEKIVSLGGSFASLTAGHVFLVHRRVSRTPASSARAGFWRLGTSAYASHVPFNDNPPYGNIYDDAGSTVRQTCGQANFDMSTANCYEVRSAANAWSNHVNGTQQSTTGTNTVGFASSPELGGHSVVATYYDGYVAELALFDRVLAAPERALLVEYFNARYALGMT